MLIAQNTAPEGSLSGYPVFSTMIPNLKISTGHYQVSFARSLEDLDAVKRLRYRVFKQELQDQENDEGIEEDDFDIACHHVIVTHLPTSAVVGTYRVQTSEMAEAFFGFYSAQEFYIEDMLKQISNPIEIGRACIAKGHRNGKVLYLLWKGLANYMTWNQKRYLFGCSSIFSTEPEVAFTALEIMRSQDNIHESIWVNPRPEFDCKEPADDYHDSSIAIPKLLSVYLSLFNAKICSMPAIDKDFKTIDFLTLGDIENIDERRYRTFFHI